MTLPPDLGLYIHWPYCGHICPYCDFNVYRPKGDAEALIRAIVGDMAHWRERTGPRMLASVHFGGGTPSLLEPEQLARLLQAADAFWGIEVGAEIGLEANPNDVDRFAGFAEAGIERLSLGVQSFSSDTLKRLGRDHDADAARKAVEVAQSTFARASIDLIYAWHGQTLENWREELQTAAVTGVGHISPYQLTIEEKTAFGKRAARGESLALEADAAADFFEVTATELGRAGFEAYEISNHARSRADQSRHNRIYWEGGDWIGVGPGAHGRLGQFMEDGRIATACHRRPAEYIQAVETLGFGIAELENLCAEDERTERVLMGLRLANGLDLVPVERATGQSIDADERDRMNALGYLESEGTRIRLTQTGRLLGDGVSMALIP